MGVGALLFMPILLRVDLFFDFQCDKVGTNLSLYGLIKLLGGYATPCPNGIAFHISNKKALVFSFRQMGEEQKGFSQKHGLRLRKIQTAIEINAEYFLPCYAVAEIGKLVLLFKENAPSFENKVSFIADENIRLFARLSLSTFLAKEIFLNVKYILFKGVNALWRKKKLAT